MFVYLPFPLSFQDSVEYIPDALEEIPRKAYDNIPEEFHKYMFIAVILGFVFYEFANFVNSTYPK
jgi:predicted Zn-dependent protease with MMP-like domain